jgi:phosphocarrier protein HPr
MKIVQKIKVRNKLGLHVRPAAMIVKLLQNSRSDIAFSHNRKTINAKSLINILTLEAHRNSNITVTVNGEDADDTMENLVSAFETRFGEKE